MGYKPKVYLYSWGIALSHLSLQLLSCWLSTSWAVASANILDKFGFACIKLARLSREGLYKAWEEMLPCLFILALLQESWDVTLAYVAQNEWPCLLESCSWRARNVSITKAQFTLKHPIIQNGKVVVNSAPELSSPMLLYRKIDASLGKHPPPPNLLFWEEEGFLR